MAALFKIPSHGKAAILIATPHRLKAALQTPKSVRCPGFSRSLEESAVKMRIASMEIQD
jgi:hypothetical protein